jgi:hypothetical protein
VEGVSLQDLVVGTLTGFAEVASAVHPPPKALGGGNDVVRDVIEDIVELVIGGISREVWMFVVSFNLEEWIAFARGSDWLVDQSLEGDKGSQDHPEKGVIDAPLPIVVVLLHHRRTLGTCPQHKFLDVLQKLLPDYLVLLRQLPDRLAHVLVRVR